METNKDQPLIDDNQDSFSKHKLKQFLQTKQSHHQKSHSNFQSDIHIEPEFEPESREMGVIEQRNSKKRNNHDILHTKKIDSTQIISPHLHIPPPSQLLTAPPTNSMSSDLISHARMETHPQLHRSDSDSPYEYEAQAQNTSSSKLSNFDRTININGKGYTESNNKGSKLFNNDINNKINNNNNNNNNNYNNSPSSILNTSQDLGHTTIPSITTSSSLSSSPSSHSQHYTLPSISSSLSSPLPPSPINMNLNSNKNNYKESQNLSTYNYMQNNISMNNNHHHNHNNSNNNNNHNHNHGQNHVHNPITTKSIDPYSKEPPPVQYYPSNANYVNNNYMSTPITSSHSSPSSPTHGSSSKKMRKKRTPQKEYSKPKKSKAKGDPNSDAVYCRLCGVTQTTEWRRGPDGFKSLCNACGIRFAKLVKKEEEETNVYQQKKISLDMLLH